MMEVQKIKPNSQENEKILTSTIQPLDPYMKLQEENNYNKIAPNINIINNKIEVADVKKRLSMEILNQMKKDPGISYEEQEKIDNLINEVRENRYYLIYSDLNGANQDLMSSLNQNAESIDKPGLIYYPNTLNFDVKLYKIGRKCHGLKERYAIIYNGELYSSDKPFKDLKEKDWEKLKVKTEFLYNAEIRKEAKDSQSQNMGEWSEKGKNYRIIVTFKDKENKESMFYLYFDDERQMKEAELAIYKLSKPKEFQTKVIGYLSRLNTLMLQGNKFYTILKFLSVKNKIKKRKATFNKVENLIQNNPTANLDSNFLQKKVLKSFNVDEPINVNEERKNLKGANKDKMSVKSKKSVGTIKSVVNYKFNDSPMSNFMPLISGVSTTNQNTLNKRSLNDMINKYKSLKVQIPKEILNSPNEGENGICFGIKNGVYVANLSGDDTKFGLKPESCNNAKFILMDKNKPEIIFKQENNDENDINDIMNNNNGQNKLNEDNIYEISNVIKNANNNMNGIEENNLILLGPKINNDIGINYTYKNKADIPYTDPENMNLKTKTINEINKKVIPGVTIQIYHCELNINDDKLKSLLNNLTGSIIEDINTVNLSDKLLFGYTIKISPLKQIESPIIKPKQSASNICFIEYNHQYFIPMEYFNENQEIIIESYCIPLISFSKEENNIPEEQLNYIAKYLSPVVIGYTKISLNDIKSGKYQYDILNKDITLSNSFILIDGMEEKVDSIILKNYNYEGKDYSIGSDSYIIKTINKEFIDKVKNNVNISDEIKDKYFNVCFDTKDENEFLLRPDESMEENEFIRDIGQKISNEDWKKILINKKYNYLPQCEKYKNRESLFNSQNLGFLTQEEKENICNKYEEGQWIYKLPEIKVKFLSKNLGVLNNNNELHQKIYCTEEEQTYPIDSLYEFSEERVMPISENNFNTFDFKEVQNINTNNYQWATGIKFNNELQMNSFIKLLNLARQNINSIKKSQRGKIIFEENKIEEFDKRKKLNLNEINDDNIDNQISLNKCDIGIQYLNFLPEYELKEDHCYLVAKILIEGLTENSIINLLEDKNYGFENSLMKSNFVQIKKSQYENGGDKKVKIVNFDRNIEIYRQKFNEDQKSIYFEEFSAEVDYNKNSINDITYNLIINLGKEKYTIPLDLNAYLKDKACDIIEIPIYANEEDNNIIGYLELSLNDKMLNDNRTFNEIYEEANKKYLREPLLIFKDSDCLDLPSKNDRFGLYEPNVYRRRLLKLIHKNKKINIDPSNLSNYDKDEEQLVNLYNMLYQEECADLPPLSNFVYYKLSNLKRNNDKEDISNSYRKKLGLKLLKSHQHEKFMKIYRKNKWDAYLKKITEGFEGTNLIDRFTHIPNKLILLKNKEYGEYLNKCMYTGVPPEYREAIYTNLLDLPRLLEKTRAEIVKIYKKDFKYPSQLYSFFANQLFDEQKRNIIFSTIDNDINIVSSLDNSTLDEINKIKKIAKTFFIWADLKIGLEDKNDKYVYFIGILTLVQQLLQNFQKEYFAFWALIGLAKNITHFHQKNPLFSDELNYINIYGLVTKLIMERHQKKIYAKFISLNIPPELFITRHLSTLFTDYFKGQLMMRILDILVFESSMQGLYTDDMQYLRVLCAIPLTLFEYSEKEILSCKSVSEIESITNDLFLYTFDKNNFVSNLGNNIEKFYVAKSFFEKWFFNTQGREWDSKRGELENLMRRHFYPVYKENKNYLLEIGSKLKNNSEEIIKNLFENLDNKLSSIKSLYCQGTSDYDDSNSFMGICVQISKLKQIYNNENSDISEYILVISFGDEENKIDSKYENAKYNINFDNQNNELINISDLYFSNQFQNDKSPKYIHFTLLDKGNNNRANFSFNILNYETMKLSNITLENNDEINKYYLEFELFKYNTKAISADDLTLYNNIFCPPEYYNSKKIEEKLYSYDVSGFYFNKEISKIIQAENNDKNLLINSQNFDKNMVEMFTKLNNYSESEDSFNILKIINKRKNNNFDDRISQKILKIIDTCFQQDVSNIIKNWLGDTNISFEEVLYGIILVDKSIISINEKLYLLFSLGQMRDKLLLNTDFISVDKLKELIYSLYKRFRIYFSKSDTERMIDYLLKDERLFNIKYAFVHNSNDKEKINEIIYDKDYYDSRLNKHRKIFEIYFDEIGKEFNIFLNYLSNHYNINTFSPKLVQYIFNSILNNKDIKNYTKNNFNTITLVIEKDNILNKRTYTIKYSPLKIIEERNSSYYINPKNEDDNLNKLLCSELSNIDINNSYFIKNYINFDKFKEIFFKLPYLSDLFRVSLSYLSQDQIGAEKQFDSFKITVEYGIKTKAEFYFPKKPYNFNEINEDNEEDISCDMGINVKLSYTVEKLIAKIIDKINKGNVKMNNREKKEIIDSLKSIYKIKCSIWYSLDGFNSGRNMQENIGYFDNLYSCFELKDKNEAEIRISIDNDILSFDSNRNLIQKKEGFCKIYYSNSDDFSWKKCKIKCHSSNNIDKVYLSSADYKTSPRILNKKEDVVFEFDI